MGAKLPCVRCGNPTSLQCPICKQQNLPQEGSAFCSKECFKSSWASHKRVHVRSSAVLRYTWTGQLRPYKISKQRSTPERIEKPNWAFDGIPKIEFKSDTRSSPKIMTTELIGRVRDTCRIARKVLDAAALLIGPGITTDEIDKVVHNAIVAAGGYPSTLNYHFFPKSCYTSVNEVICHGIPDTRRLQDGDIVNVDVTVYYKGVHGDLNETFFVGAVDEASKQLVRCSYECLERAISIVKPGAMFSAVGKVISQHASASGYSVVKSYCGHDIGERFHCASDIPYYARNKARGVMQAGQVFTIGTMVNAAGGSDDRLWPDGWTVVTSDGKRSAQFGHTLLVTETGVEVLTARLFSSPNVFPWLPNRDWSELPPDVLRKCCNKLTDISFFINFRLVCKSWGSAAEPGQLNPQPPLLFLKYRPGDPHIRFFSLVTRKITTLYLPKLEDQTILGSHHGWLIVVSRQSDEISLFHPFIREEINLPSLPGLRSFYNHWSGSRKRYHTLLTDSPGSVNCKLIIIILSDGTKPPVIVVHTVSGNRLGLWMVKELGMKLGTYLFDDLFYIGGRILFSNTLEKKIYWCDATLPTDPVMVNEYESPFPESFHPQQALVTVDNDFYMWGYGDDCNVWKLFKLTTSNPIRWGVVEAKNYSIINDHGFISCIRRYVGSCRKYALSTDENFLSDLDNSVPESQKDTVVCGVHVQNSSSNRYTVVSYELPSNLMDEDPHCHQCYGFWYFSKLC